MSSLLEGIAMTIGVLLLVVFTAAALLTIVLLAALTCATIIITSPFWLLVALFRPEAFKGAVDAAMR